MMPEISLVSVLIVAAVGLSIGYVGEPPEAERVARGGRTTGRRDEVLAPCSCDSTPAIPRLPA